MGFSIKQKLFAEFMLRKIGLTKNEDIEIYLSQLEKLYGRMISYPSQRFVSGVGWRYSVSDCIDLLIQEVDLKKSKYTIKAIEPKDYITSTDLANYDYCAASFVISSSFIIENPSGIEFTEIGKQLHEQLIVAKTNWKKDDDDYVWSSEAEIEKIRKCQLIFSGHGDENTQFKNGNWVGVPDYIFKDERGSYFVVEEKFHKKRDPRKTSTSDIEDVIFGRGLSDERTKEIDEWANSKGYFFSNHIVQLTSYIKNHCCPIKNENDHPSIGKLRCYWIF